MWKPAYDGAKHPKEGLSEAISVTWAQNSASCDKPMPGTKTAKQLYTNTFMVFLISMIPINCFKAKIQRQKAFVKLIIVNNFVLLPP